MVRLTPDPIDHSALTEVVRRPGCGAVVTFLGTVRDLTEGRVTVALDYEAYPGMAEKKMAAIEADTRSRWPVGCPHRGQAFDACRYAIDRLKELVPIWKKENWADGSTEWVHPANANEE